MDAVALRTIGAFRGRRSRVVLTPRRWRQARDDAMHHTGDGDNKARSPGRVRRKPLKPSRAGMPGDPGELVVTNARAYYSTRAAAGATGTRHSPRPLFSEGGTSEQNSGASRGEKAEACLELERRHCLRQTRSVCARERSDEAIHSFFVRRDGLLRSARNDGLKSALPMSPVAPQRSPRSSVSRDQTSTSRVDALPRLRQAWTKSITSGGHRCSVRKTINS